MPAVRTYTPSVARTRSERTDTAKPSPEYAGTLTRLRAKLRCAIRDGLRIATGRPKTVMHWTPHGYARSIVYGRGLWLEGWPNKPKGENIRFGDPSDIRGGQPIISRLLELWELGLLRFRPATDEERRLAYRDPYAVLPGKPLKRPAPRCWGPYGRNDIGRPRSQPTVFDADGKPVGRRWKRLGAITPKLCLEDELVDHGEELPSSDELDSDPIQDGWTDDERDVDA